MCRRYTNITRVKITRVIFDMGQNDSSVDEAIVPLGYCNSCDCYSMKIVVGLCHVDT